MADPLGSDQFDVEALAEAEIEKLLKQVCNKCNILSFSFKIQFWRIHGAANSLTVAFLSVSYNRSGTIKFYWNEGEGFEEV